MTSKDQVNRIIDILLSVYKKDGNEELLEILSNPDYRLEEGEYDFGETWYVLVFVIPTEKYIEIRRDREKITTPLVQDINDELGNIFGERPFIQNIRLVPPLDLDESTIIPGDNITRRIWKPSSSSIKVFISHITKYKNIAMDLKNNLLDRFGISSFVAHHDIEPTEEWRGEILNALSSFDVFIALLTEGFEQSNWTDQEIGFAVARNKLIIPINIGVTPYGFISKYQQLKYKKDNDIGTLSNEVIEILEKKLSTSRIADMWIEILCKARTFSNAKNIINDKLLIRIESLSENQKNRIKELGEQNYQVRGVHDYKKLISIINKSNDNGTTNSNETPEFDEEDIPFS